MAEVPTRAAAAAEADQALLADVGGLRVEDDLDGTVWLDCGDGRANVSVRVWAFERAGWVEQLEGTRLWSLTVLGFDALEGRL